MNNKLLKVLLSIFLVGSISVTAVACNNSSDEQENKNEIIQEETEEGEKQPEEDNDDDQEVDDIPDGDEDGQAAEEEEEKNEVLPEQEKIIVKTDTANIENIIRNYNALLSNLTEDESIDVEYMKRTAGSDEFYKETVEKIKSLRASNKVYNANDINILEVYQLSGEKDVYYAKVSQKEDNTVRNYEYKIINSSSASGILTLKEE